MANKENVDDNLIEFFERLSIKKQERKRTRIAHKEKYEREAYGERRGENRIDRSNVRIRGTSDRCARSGRAAESSVQPVLIDESKEEKIRSQPNGTKLNNPKFDIVFPWFDYVKYKHICDHFQLKIPRELMPWVESVFNVILKTENFFDETETVEWLVLIYPSLLLIVQEYENNNNKNNNKTKNKNTRNRRGYKNNENSNNSNSNSNSNDSDNSDNRDNSDAKYIAQLAREVIECMRDFMGEVMETSHPSVNNLLICLELYEENGKYNFDKNRKTCNGLMNLMSLINQMFVKIDTIEKFAKLSLSNKGYQSMIKLPYYKETSLKSSISLVRESWGMTTAVYTHLSRLHRLFYFEKLNNLSLFSKECINNVCKIFYQFSIEYLPNIRKLWPLMIEISQNAKLDFCFYRYKTLCMSTHTPTTIAATFGGYIGYIDNRTLEMTSQIGETIFVQHCKENGTSIDDINNIVKGGKNGIGSRRRRKFGRSRGRSKSRSKSRSKARKRETQVKQNNGNHQGDNEQEQQQGKEKEKEKEKQKEKEQEKTKMENLSMDHDLSSYYLMFDALNEDFNKYIEILDRVFNTEYDSVGGKIIFKSKQDNSNDNNNNNVYNNHNNKSRNKRRMIERKQNHTNENDYRKLISKMKTRESEPLRELDNIAYLSVCQLIMAYSLPQSANNLRHLKQIVDMRNKLRQYMTLLAKNSLCFSNSIDRLSGNVFQNSFLISAKYGRTQWVVHLMAATLLCLWKQQ